ncbi:MAG: hypothetical protein NDJ90_09710 [Oligoflexia bacterium]|nr:hypothetical protein [Oligoflexia bacterium]
MLSPLVFRKFIWGLPRGLAGQLRLLARRHQGITRALLICGSYAAWIVFFRLLVLTFITYFVMSSPGTGRRFEEVSEAFGSAELAVMGLGSFLYVVLALALNPLASRSLKTAFLGILSARRIESQFLPGFTHGAILASGIVLAFVLSGSHRYLGFFIHSAATGFAIGSVLLRSLGLLLLACCEEFLFRQKILESLRSPDPTGDGRRLTQDLTVATLVSILYCAIKALQFDFGLMHLITLFLVSFHLSLRALSQEDFGWGAGYWAALLLLFHPVLSLPIFGSEFSGTLLVKYQASLTETGETGGSTMRFLTGGAGGPLSAFVLQILLIFDILRAKILLNPARQKLR